MKGLFSLQDVARELRTTSGWILFAALTAMSIYVMVRYQDNAYRTVTFRPGDDFYHSIWLPGKQVLHGQSPYPSPSSPTLATSDSVYPPPVFLAGIALSLISIDAARWIWIGLLAILSAATFLLLGVRDPRCIVVAMLSAPIVSGLMWGNATLLVSFTAALAWHLRNRSWPAASAYAAGAAVKLFLLPLAFWLLITGRVRTALRGVLAVAVVIAIGWAAIGFTGLTSYPAILRHLTDYQASHGLFLSALLAYNGINASDAVFLGAIPAVALFALAWQRRRQDATVFALTLIAIEFLTPVNHTYNLELLMMAVALVRPRLSLAWAIMPLTWWTTWNTPLQEGNPNHLFLFGMGLAAATAAVVVLPGRGLSGRASTRPSVPARRTAS